VSSKPSCNRKNTANTIIPALEVYLKKKKNHIEPGDELTP